MHTTQQTYQQSVTVEKSPFVACIVTNGRHVALLNMLVRRWNAVGVHVVVVAPEHVCVAVAADSVHCVPFDTSPNKFGDARQRSLDVYPEKYCLTTDDDVYPMTDDWTRPGCEPNAIRSIRLVSVLGQRWTDWAYFDGSGVYNQPYGHRHPGTYITGAAQLIAPEVRARVSYNGRKARQSNDILYCHDAEKAGYKLLPPIADGPVLLHMDRLPPHPSDPDRYGAKVA